MEYIYINKVYGNKGKHDGDKYARAVLKHYYGLSNIEDYQKILFDFDDTIWARGADKDTTLNAIKEHCASKLPVNHIPTLAKLYDTALPVAPSGKLDIAKMENDTENITEI